MWELGGHVVSGLSFRLGKAAEGGLGSGDWRELVVLALAHRPATGRTHLSAHLATFQSIIAFYCSPCQGGKRRR